MISGRLEDGDERYNIGVVCCDELIRGGVLIEMLKFVDDDVDGTLSRFFVHLLVKARGKVKGVLPGCLAVCGSGFVCMVEMVPEMLHVVLGVG